MITTGLAATDRNAIILSEIQVQEFSAAWDRAHLAQEGDFITEAGQTISRAHLERTLARAELTLEILRAALEPEPAAPSAGLANLAAFLNLAPGSAEPLAELDPSDPVAVQVAHLTARVAELERQAQAVDVLLRAQLAEAEAAQTYDDTASTREGYTHYQAWQQARRQLETTVDAYTHGHLYAADAD